MPGIPPWHLWGDTKQVTQVSTAANAQKATTQIARIRYARPETWRWIWGVTLVGGDTGNGATSSTLQVVMQVTTGIGRSQYTLELGRFVFNWGAGNPPIFDPFTNLQGKKWTNNINGPTPDDTANPLLPNVINHFVGQDIQVGVISLFTSVGGGGGIAGNSVIFEVTTLFAPNVHVRPEWHLRGNEAYPQFPGDEHTGSKL